MHQFQIKPASITEIPSIQEIIALTWKPAYRAILPENQLKFMETEIYNTQALEDQMGAGQLFFILYVNQIPAGFAAYSPAQVPTFKLNKLYVKPLFQGQGFGGLLIRHVEQEVQNRGGKTLILNVNRHNQARQKYERLGYAVVAEEDIPIGEFWMNDYVMQKNLSNP